jgi:hypothetical protein
MIMRRIVVFVVLAAMLAGWGCSWYYESDPETGLEALYQLDREFISRRGAHTYIQATGPQAPNALYAREYSDLMSHFGQYKPVISPLLEMDPAMGCVLDQSAWYPFEIEQVFACSEGSVVVEFAYVGGQDFAIRVAGRQDFTGPSIDVRGCGYDNGDGLLTTDLAVDAGRVFMRQALTLYSFWGVEAHENRSYTIAARADDIDVVLAAEGACWTGSLPADRTSVVTYRVEQDWAVGTGLEVPLPSVLEPLDSTGFSLANLETIDELVAWFDESPVRGGSDQLAMMSWYLLWENTAAPWGDKWVHESVVPSKRHYFRGVWLWDAGFIALALAKGNADARALGVNQIRNIVENAASDGRFPREVWAHDAGTGYQPPGILTWAAWELAIWGGDDAVLDEFYDAFVANHQWFVDSTDSDGDGRCEWTREDSGMDTSPRFDDGPVEGVDLQAWLALDAQLLGWIAERTGRAADVDAWLAEADDRRQDIRDNFWDAADGMFYDRIIDDAGAADPFVRVVTPVTFIPMMIGAATPAQAAAVAAHLDDQDFFKAPFGLPTTPITSDVYESANYWRGPTWIVMNAFAFLGLLNYDLNDAATQLRQQTLDMMAQSPTTWEYYDSTTGQGIGSPDFMWSAVFYLKMLYLDYTPFGQN